MSTPQKVSDGAGGWLPLKTTENEPAKECCCVVCPTEEEFDALPATLDVVISGQTACELCINYVAGESKKDFGTIDGTYTLTKQAWGMSNWYQLLGDTTHGVTVETSTASEDCSDGTPIETTPAIDFEAFCDGGLMRLRASYSSLAFGIQTHFSGAIAWANPMVLVNGDTCVSGGGGNSTVGINGTATFAW